ncbi:MAG TPA: type VI secretion system TssO [Bacteroidia bacterium]|nr:type VI secretion system TssO [Bacteroidia bacterium]
MLKFRISKEEKKLQFLYLVSLWVLMSILFAYVCFHNSFKEGDVRPKELMLEEINKKKQILKTQKESIAYVDSLNRWITQFQPSTSQVYLTNSISTELDMLQKIYTAKKANPDYKIFDQLYVFYTMPFFDKKSTWNATQNTAIKKKKLEDCMIGFKEKQNDLHLKNMLNSQTNINK